MRQFRTSMGSSIESRSGPDIIHMLNSWSHLYQRGLTDVSDLAEWKAKDQGGFYDVSLASVRVQPLWRDILHAPLPAGPAGQFACHTAFAHGIMKYSKEQRLAKDFLKWLHSKEQFVKWFEVEETYSVGSTTFWETHPLWERFDASIRPFRTAARGARMFGHAGPPTAKASEAYSKYIIIDMYAKVVRGMTPADVAKWAEGELRKIYR